MAEQSLDKLSEGVDTSTFSERHQAMESKRTPASFTFESNRFLSAPSAWETAVGGKQNVSSAVTEVAANPPQQTFTFGFSALRSRSPSFTFTPPASDKVRSSNAPRATTPETSPTPMLPPRCIEKHMEALKIEGPLDCPHKHSSSESGHVHNETPNNVQTCSGTEHEPMTRLATDDSTVKEAQQSDLEQKMLTQGLRESDKFLVPPSPRRGHVTSARRRRRSSKAPDYEHDVASEAPPDDAFHDTRFQEAFFDAKRLVGKLVTTLQSCLALQNADQDLQNIYNQAVDLNRREKASSRIVGLVGDSGVGKSSLINSLLNYQDLARSDNFSGEACTCVATEYHYHASKEFVIEVEYFTESELTAQFGELLQAYRWSENAPVPEKGHQLQDDEYKSLKETAKIAEYTFRAAFRGRIEPVQELLKEPHDEVLQKLLKWTRDLDVPLGDGRTVPSVQTPFDDHIECAKKLAELTSEESSAKRHSKWPFIKKVKLFSNAYVLSQGLILADLPARVKVTENYLKKCHEILVVCQIGRAKTSTGVQEVFNLAKRVRLRGHIGIVCTSSDDIHEDEAARGLQGPLANKVQMLRTELQAIDIEIKDKRERLDGNMELVNEVQHNPELDEYSKEEELRALQVDKAQLLVEMTEREKFQEERKKELNACLIDARNLNVVNGLQKLYRSPPDNTPAQVFCVSNKTYWEHRKAKAKEECQHYLELSGILRLRRYCLSVVSNGQYQHATQYMQDEIPALLSRLDVWAQRGTADFEKKEALREIVDEVTRELGSIVQPTSQIHAIAEQMDDQFRQLIIHIMEKCSDRWTAEAASVARGIAGTYHPNTFKAFCSKFGDHSTRNSHGRHIWNDEAMSAMFADMNPYWDPSVHQLRHFFANTAFFIKDCFNRAIASAETERVTQALSTKLPTILKTQKQLLINHLNSLFEQCENNIRVIWSNAFSGLRTSFIGQLMEHTYTECNLDGGAGSDWRRKNRIENAFGSPQLLTTHRHKLSEAFLTLAGDLQTRIYEETSFRIEIITKDMNLLMVGPVMIDNQKARESRAKVQEAVSKARQQLDALTRSWQPIELPGSRPRGYELDTREASSLILLSETASAPQLPA